jgi:DNA-binding GntR family transcriptional regulator
MQLNPLQGPVSLDRFAYDAIKEAILTFRLTPGQTLVESELAEQLKISKTPVRSALLRLEKEGLVVKSHYRGAVVAELSPRKMKELFEVRAALEGMAARLAAEYAGGESLSQLRDIYQAEAEALHDHDRDAAAEQNVRFHGLLISIASNEWLENFLANLDDHLRRYRFLSNYQTGRLDKSVGEHQEIMDALDARDGDRAEAAMRRHLLSVLHDLDEQDLQQLIANIED